MTGFIFNIPCNEFDISVIFFLIRISSFLSISSQTGNSIAIGRGAVANGGNSIAIGNVALINGFTNSVAIGAGASCTANNQITLGTALETVRINTITPLYTTLPTFVAGQIGYIYSSPTVSTIQYNVGSGTLINFANIPVGVYICFGTIAIGTTSSVVINFFNLNIRIATTNIQSTAPISFPSSIPNGYGSSYQIGGVINQTVANTSINLFTTFVSASGTWSAVGTFAQLIRIA